MVLRDCETVSMARSNDPQVLALHRLLEEAGEARTSRRMSAWEIVASWARKHSLAAISFGSGCCGAELEAAAGPRFDLERFGCSVPGLSPRHADLLVVTSGITPRLAPHLRRLYEGMAEPRWVMALGACSCAGDSRVGYAAVAGADGCVPVDVYVPGCPPRPEAILDGLLKLQERIGIEVVPRSGRSGGVVKLRGQSADSSAGT